MVRFDLLARAGVLLLTPLALPCRAVAQVTPPPGASGRVVSGVGAKAQPISGARVQLWAVLNTSLGAPVTPLIAQAVLTDSNGYFQIEGQFRCPTPETLVFFTAMGGSPRLPNGAQNPLIGLETAIGACSKLTATTFTTINELTTIAALGANLPNFLATGELGYTGWNPGNALLYETLFQEADWQVNPSTGQSPGLDVPAGTAVPVVNLHSGANVLAACVRSTGDLTDGASACSRLFRVTSLLGPTTNMLAAVSFLTGTTPSLLFDLSLGGPFQPALKVAPAYWGFPPTVTDQPAAPVITLTPGGYATGPETVTITDATPGTKLFYYLGQIPAYGNSKPYTGPFTLYGSSYVNAIAISTANVTSTSGEPVDAYGTALPPQVFSPPGGVYYAPQVVQIYNDFSPVLNTIFYTTDGSTPNQNSPFYFYPGVTISADTTLKAIQIDTGDGYPGSYLPSPVSTAVYTIYQPLASPPAFTPGGDTYAGPQTVTISAPGATAIHYTTDGSKPTLSSPVYGGPISVTASETINVLAIGAGGSSNRSVAAASYTIAKPGAYGTIESLRVRPLLGPTGVTIDTAGDLDIANAGEYTIIQVRPSGVLKRLAGSIALGNLSGDGGPAIDAGVHPFGVTTDAAGDLFFTDSADNVVRKIAGGTGVITTIAGIPQLQNEPSEIGFSGDEGPAKLARLDLPGAIAADRSGNVYFADMLNNRIRRIDAKTGVITTVAGGPMRGFSGDGGPATAAALNEPTGLVFNAAGDMYISDAGNGRIRRVSATTGVITTIAGQTNDPYFRGDGGPAIEAYFGLPPVYTEFGALAGLAIDPEGDLFVIDGNTVRKIDRAGVITTVVGGGANAPATGVGDNGYATDGVLNGPTALAVDSAGALYIADQGNNRVRKVVF